MLLRFTVTGVTGTVSRATLRLHRSDTGSSLGDGAVVTSLNNNTWSETGTTWNNQPAVNGASLGSLRGATRDSWYEVDVTSRIIGNGTYSIAIDTPRGGAVLDSRESGADTAPRLSVATVRDTKTPAGSEDPVLVGAGDIAGPGEGKEATAELLDKIPGTVFTAGDNAYQNGSSSDFSEYYEPSWGRHKARTRPSPGNHDYYTSGARDYYEYFGDSAGPAGLGYYSYDLGTWHIVSLNSETDMAVGSSQEKWLRQDLSASTKPCTLAYWHKPRFTSGAHSNNSGTGPLVEALYEANAEVIVTGHNHQYERFAPMDPDGRADDAKGIRHITIGNGGIGFYEWGTIQPNSEKRNNDTYGVMKFTLRANSYDWQFVPEAGKSFTDEGTGACH
jgi:hypothetical protein